jgi:hypothetical protein
MAPVLTSVLPARNWSTGRFGHRTGRTSAETVGLRKSDFSIIGMQPVLQKGDSATIGVVPFFRLGSPKTVLLQPGRLRQPIRPNDNRQVTTKFYFLEYWRWLLFRNFRHNSVDKAHNF